MDFVLFHSSTNISSSLDAAARCFGTFCTRARGKTCIARKISYCDGCREKDCVDVESIQSYVCDVMEHTHTHATHRRRRRELVLRDGELQVSGLERVLEAVLCCAVLCCAVLCC
jgi:hypothetical protein